MAEKKKKKEIQNRAGYWRRMTDETRARVMPVKRWTKLSKLPRASENLASRQRLTAENSESFPKPRAGLGEKSGEIGAKVLRL